MKGIRKRTVSAVLLAACVAVAVSAQDGPRITAHYTGRFTDERQINFVRQPDSTCACLSDTTQGPSVWCYGARWVTFRLQANSGTCSTMTVQVSNNDTTWKTVSSLSGLTAVSDFVTGDSLNAGGTIVTLTNHDATNLASGVPAAIQWRYARMFARQKAGVTSNNNCATLCRAKVDSLRFKAYVGWTAP